MALTNNFNYLQPTGFKLVIDRKNYPNLEFFAQDFTHAGVIMNTADLGYKKVAAIPFIGDKLTYNEMLANIILDEDMKSYTEMHNWMRRNLDRDNVTALDRFKNATQRPPAQSDIQFQATGGAESFLTFGASFRFTYFDIKTFNATTGAITDSFDVTGTVTG